MVRKRFSSALVVVLLSIPGLSCVVDEDDSKEILVRGTVAIAAVGSQCWVIQTAAAENYEISNLAAEYQEVGLQVVAHVRILDNRASACMIGPIAEVIEIERVD